MQQNNQVKKSNSIHPEKVRIEKDLLAHLPKMYRDVAQYLIDNNDWELVDATGSA